MKNFINSNFNITNIVLSCYVPVGTGNNVHQNRPSHGLALHITGEKEYVFSDGLRLLVKGGDIIFLPKNSSYTVIPNMKGDCYAINFDIDKNIDFKPFQFKVKHFNTLAGFFSSAKNAWQHKKDGYPLKCTAELYNILYALHQEYYAQYFPKSKAEIIRPAVDHIHLKYAEEDISIDALSKMCKISPEYFRRIFKSFYGVSPISYINNLKITRAKELLESGMYSVAEAAGMSGFKEMSYFSREFKKGTGVSPSEYKKSVQP